MFFPERITLIKPNDRVLEIGPGNSPHSRADVLLEMAFENKDEYAKQYGETPVETVDERVVYYDGTRFPFKDNEFDYVICSHVIEHVPDIELFCRELFRVAKTGYMEFPLLYYDYLFDFSVHVNLCKWNDKTFVYAKKEEIFPSALKPVQEFWRATLNAGYGETISHLVPYLMQGFEWSSPFNVRRTNRVEDLVHERLDIVPKQLRRLAQPGLLSRVKGKILRLRGELLGR